MRLAILLSCAALTAAVEPAFLEYTMPDAVRAKQRLAGSPLLRIAELREWALCYDEVLKQLPDQTGGSMVKLWQAHESQVRVGFPAVGVASPSLDCRWRIPGQTEVIAAELAKAQQIPGGIVKAEGDWVIMTSGAALAGVPATTTDRDADLTLHLDLPGLGAQLPPESKPVVTALISGPMSITATCDVQGTREQGVIGLRLPFLVPVDPAPLGGLPTDPLLLLAVGIDGPALNRWLGDLSADAPEVAKGLAALDEELQRNGQPSSGTVLESLAGTAFIAVLPSAPVPSITVAVPGSPVLDSLITSLAATAGVDLRAATTGAVPLPMQRGMPFAYQVRRSASHWLLSSDVMQFERIASHRGGTFDQKIVTELAGARHPSALLISDNRQISTAILGVLPLAMAGFTRDNNPETQRVKALIAAFQRALAVTAPLLPASVVVLTTENERLRLDGRNSMITVGVVGPMLAGMLLPAVTLVRQKAQQTKAGNNMKQLLTGCIAWSCDHEGKMPPDLVTLCKEVQIPETMLVDPRAPKALAQPHFLYVRSNEEPSSRQPVLIENPAAAPGKAILVCCADSSLRLLPPATALQIWNLAVTLAADPKAAAAGIAWDDWAPVAELLP